jgi:cytochrome c553
MKKLLVIAIAILVIASVAVAQNPTYTRGTGITGIDKLGAHQNGGRGCVGCHAPHSGGRGNGGGLTLTSSWNGTTRTWSNQVTDDGANQGDDALWGQDLGPVLGMGTITTGNGYAVNLALAETTQPRILTGVVMCLSCHDGNVAKGAMMTNQSFEQAAGLLPATYGSQPIPTLLGDDGGAAGNYGNDHPLGQNANVGALPIAKYLDLDAAANPTKLILKATQPDVNYTTFQTNYGLPIVTGARVGAGFVVEASMTSVNQAYVVCTTCHTPHTMYTASASATNKIAGLSAGTFPTYFFLAAPYNPGADVAGSTKASSATQFCRQCHFTGAGGANEGSGIMNIPTAF